jgi:dTDP-4-amino-4,6-dideoxygalactose transaminase
MKRIQEIADIYGLKIIYDAAHAFGVRVNVESVLKAGDMSTLSFHATKVYNTIEGGALICHDEATKKRIDYLKNFGFADETTVVAPGINSKMDEIRSAYGLLNLKQVDCAIEKRKAIANKYRAALKDIAGIRFLPDIEGVRHNYAYFPIFISEEYGVSRDDLYALLQKHNIYGRRYFYPLISTFSAYKGLDSANPANLPVAHKLANQVLCLPMFATLDDEGVNRVIEVITNKK